MRTIPNDDLSWGNAMTIGQLKIKIDALNLQNGNSNPFDYRDAYDDFVQVLQKSTDADEPHLKEVLQTFRGKLLAANLEEFNDLKNWAKKLDEAFTSKSVGQLVQAIRDRNVALPELLKRLTKETERGNEDADLLTRIKEAIEKGAKTIDELKALVDALSETDATAKERILTLIEAARNISSTFIPGDDGA
jgi:DNA repair exonuclease SbcCD ATPase subunit